MKNEEVIDLTLQAVQILSNGLRRYGKKHCSVEAALKILEKPKVEEQVL